jgi:hypothetical protein
MPAKRQMGAAKIKDKTVTYSEPEIKGQKPNEPLEGAHSEEKRSFDKEAFSKRGMAFKYKPMPIIRGIRRMVAIEATIHILEILSKNILLNNMHLF